MAKIFEKPTRIRQVLTCKSKWTKHIQHRNRLTNDLDQPTHFFYEKHCLVGALACLADLDSYHYKAVKAVINKLCEQGKLPKKSYTCIGDFNDHCATEWKHIQLVIRHLPKDV